MKSTGDKIYLSGALSMVFFGLAKLAAANDTFHKLRDFVSDVGLNPDTAFNAWGLASLAVMCYGIYRGEGEKMAAARRLFPKP